MIDDNYISGSIIVINGSITVSKVLSVQEGIIVGLGGIEKNDTPVFCKEKTYLQAACK